MNRRYGMCLCNYKFWFLNSFLLCLLLAAIFALCTYLTIFFYVMGLQEWHPLCNVVVQEHTKCKQNETYKSYWRWSIVPVLPLDDDTDDPNKDNFDCIKGCSSGWCNTISDFATSNVVNHRQGPLCYNQSDDLAAVRALIIPSIAILHLRLRNLGAEWIIDVFIDRHKDCMEEKTPGTFISNCKCCLHFYTTKEDFFYNEEQSTKCCSNNGHDNTKNIVGCTLTLSSTTHEGRCVADNDASDCE